jgi:hypothetical protein
VTDQPHNPTIGELVMAPSVSGAPVEFLGWCPMSQERMGFVRQRHGCYVHKIETKEIRLNPHTEGP